MDLQEMEWGAWTGLTWLRIGIGSGALVSVVINFQFP